MIQPNEFFLIGQLMARINYWSAIYYISIQFWGEDENNVYISKDDVELYAGGGFTMKEAIENTLEYLERINPKFEYPNLITPHNFQP